MSHLSSILDDVDLISIYYFPAVRKARVAGRREKHANVERHILGIDCLTA